MSTPTDRKYAATHEWGQLDGDTLIVGISDFAQQELGDIVFVELPAVGRSVSAGEAVAVVESVKTASDIHAPAAGEVVAVNDALENSPESINEDPYGAGWLFKLHLADGGALAGLLDAAAYDAKSES